MVEIRHPSLWLLICRLKDQDKKTARELRQVKRGVQLGKRKAKWRRLQTRIQTLKDEYRSGRRNFKDYWSAVKYAVHNHAQNHRLGVTLWHKKRYINVVSYC